jgi:CBS-domain-containing membrane protein
MEAFPAAAGRRHHRVEDVMTATVVTVDRHAPYQEIARLLAEHQISGLPVLAEGWQVIGVVSEADLLAAEDMTARRARARSPRHARLTAGELMTSPAVTVRPDATIAYAVQVMTRHHVRRLPVTGADETLIGIVSRRDLLSVFLRPDADVGHDIRRALDEIPLADPASVIATVRHGVVTLTGTAGSGAGQHRHIMSLILRQVWAVDGVVDVVSWLKD